MSDYIEKITKGGEEYDIHDKRVDNLAVGTKLYYHSINLVGSTTVSLIFVTDRAEDLEFANLTYATHVLRFASGYRNTQYRSLVVLNNEWYCFYGYSMGPDKFMRLAKLSDNSVYDFTGLVISSQFVEPL